ncbi:HD domain-containing phosphohydrolase [Aquipseudomonas alcaligenes]|uniref:HD domain-containing phosphohydrolase n=1 Tax=Aquipseudomonas alcaligenes TaxID=43263 RepID=UPI00374A706B
MPTSFRLRSLIIVTFLLLICGIGALTALLAYERSADAIRRQALTRAVDVGAAATREFFRLTAPVRSGVELLGLSSLPRMDAVEGQLRALPFMATMLHTSSAARGFYFADTSGSLFYVRRAQQPLDNTAPANSAYVALSIVRAGDKVQALRLYFDLELNELARHVDAEVAGLDPRQRAWYTQAMASHELIRTGAYTFFSSGERGYTVAMATQDRQFVAAADFRHALLNEVLGRYRLTSSTRMLLLDEQGMVIASDRGEDFLKDLEGGVDARKLGLQALAQLVEMPEGKMQQFSGDRRDWYLQRLSLPHKSGGPLYLGIAIPADELLKDARDIRNAILLQTLVILLLSLPVAVWLSGFLVDPILRLAAAAERLNNFEFNEPLELPTRIVEVRQLAANLNHSRVTQQRFVELALQLNDERDFERLLPTLLRITTEACQAIGGLLYVKHSADTPPRLMAGRWGAHVLEVASDAPSFAVSDAMRSRHSELREADPQASAALGLPPSLSVAVPLFTRQGHGAGVLVLFFEHAPAHNEVRFIEALAGFAALALETRGLLERQKALFESFIQLIASAIDAKSAYTGGHCSRVPEAARLLAAAACAESHGPYASFAMNEHDWQALHIATWLHDCGKVTTPEYVVDKATKLETLYDRIHEVRMRFEVLKRDAEIDYLRAVQAGADEAQTRAARDQLLATLDEEFAFVAECNTGFVDDERLQRLQRIAQRTWLRTLDDRLGISGEERMRKDRQPLVAVPVLEPLLADRPEQCVERRASERYEADNPWGFRMPIPELLYDRGELKNLSIRRGTLTEEERYKINEHIVQTIRMLTALPFPPELAAIPEIAGGHHERIDGKGYPRGLTGEQLSPQARMLAIADVFEALTARDRPYKPSKTLSQALRIMRSMCEEGHLDRELFRIFVASGACLAYAQRYLDEDQLDARDLSQFVPPAAA